MKEHKKTKDYKLIYSPRTTLSKQKIKEEQLYSELGKSFDPYTVKFLKRHFMEHLGYLNKELFIAILKRHLLTWNPNIPNREETLVKLLSRLFDEIDMDSSGGLDWDEFSNYIIHVANSKKSEYSVYTLQQYKLSKENFDISISKSKDLNDYSNNIINVINYCFYIEKFKSIGMSYEGSSKIYFFNTETYEKYGFCIDLLIMQKEIDKFEITELEEKTEKMLKKEEEKLEKLLIKKRSTKDVMAQVFSKKNTNQNNSKNLKINVEAKKNKRKSQRRKRKS